MIDSFANQDTADLFAGQRVKRFANVASVAQRKLQQLDSAAKLDALKVPPGNRLEALRGDRKGPHSIRINDQFRCVLSGRLTGFMTWKSWITAEVQELTMAIKAPKNGMRPVHPGEILREDYLKPLGMSANALSQALKVPASRVNDIVLERRGITVDTAMRLVRYFGGDVQSWMNLQTAWEVKVAEKELVHRIAKEVLPMAA